MCLWGSLKLSGLLLLIYKSTRLGWRLNISQILLVPVFSDPTYEPIIRIPKLKQSQCCLQFGMHWRDVTRFSVSVERGKKKNSLPAAWVSQKAKLFLVKTTKQAWAFICIFSATGHRHLAHIPGKDLPTPLLQSNSEINVLSWIRTTHSECWLVFFFLQSASWLSCQAGSHQVGLTASVGELRSISGLLFFPFAYTKLN